MFNDERINFEISKLKKIIIIVSMIIAFVFLIVKIVSYKAGNIPLAFFVTEIMMIVSGLVILLGLGWIKSQVKDEAYYQKKSDYLNKYFKIYLYIVFISFAVTIPKTAVTESGVLYSSNTTINLSMMVSLIFGYGYFRYKKIYFNYPIIEETTKFYLKGVLKNILQILKFFGIIYGISLVVSIFYMINYDIKAILLAIFLGYIFTALTNSIYYFLISLLEKLFFKEENKRIITTPTLILLILAFFTLIIYYAISIFYQQLATGDIDITNYSQIYGLTIGELLAFVSQLNMSILEFLRFFVGLAIIFLCSDVVKTTDGSKNHHLEKILSPILISIIIFILYNLVYSQISPRINYYLNISFSIDTVTKIFKWLMYANNTVKSMFFIILSFIIIVKLMKFMTHKLLTISYFVLWIITYGLILTATYSGNEDLIIPTYQIFFIPLSIIALIWSIVKYVKKDNLIKQGKGDDLIYEE